MQHAPPTTKPSTHRRAKRRGAEAHASAGIAVTLEPDYATSATAVPQRFAHHPPHLGATQFYRYVHTVIAGSASKTTPRANDRIRRLPAAGCTAYPHRPRPSYPVRSGSTRGLCTASEAGASSPSYLAWLLPEGFYVTRRASDRVKQAITCEDGCGGRARFAIRSWSPSATSHRFNYNSRTHIPIWHNRCSTYPRVRARGRT